MLLTAIVPDNFDSAKKRGLDVKTQGREDLIEIFISGLGDDPFIYLRKSSPNSRASRE